MTGRAPSREERALWRAATRDVAPLANETDAPPPAGPLADPPERLSKDLQAGERRVGATPSRRSAKHLPSLTHEASPGLDRRTAERLRGGALPIEARLDLHGMTQAEAHRALDAFLARAVETEKRCVLVITGKGGRTTGDGILRAAVPRWLNEAPNRAHLLAFAPAQPKHGGAGALYLLLRRRR
jgi:DNA-nicking Smr family endonuclease